MSQDKKRKEDKKWFHCWDQSFELRETLWHLIKNEIEDWLESKMLIFTQEESAGSWLSTQNWVDEYIYSDVHKIFFTDFSIMLHEWLSILERRQTIF